MKNYKSISAVCVLFLLLTAGFLNAQSDYEIVQDFKSRYTDIQDKIKNAGGLDDCFAIENDIIKLKGDFTENKSLLDNSLYPDNFNQSIDNLASALETRRGDFIDINDLQSEVVELKDRISLLDRQNAALLGQIKDLEDIKRKDAAKINELQELTSKLRSNLRRKDELVVGIIDSLLAEFVNHPFTLNDAERISFDKKIEYNNLFYNVNRTLTDNIEFIKITQLNSQDIADIKEKYKRFSKMWKQIGPKLAEIYLNRDDRTASIERIDYKFIEWNNEIDAQIWRNINGLFKEKDIKIPVYTNGKEFTDRITNFIEDEINNFGIKKVSESERIYYNFSDTLWFGKLESGWIPVLVENNMLTDAQKDTIDSRIAQWKERVVEDELSVWVYIIGIIVLIAIVWLLSSIMRKNK